MYYAYMDMYMDLHSVYPVRCLVGTLSVEGNSDLILGPWGGRPHFPMDHHGSTVWGIDQLFYLLWPPSANHIKSKIRTVDVSFMPSHFFDHGATSEKASFGKCCNQNL